MRAAAGLVAAAAVPARAGQNSRALYAAARRGLDGGYSAAVFDEAGRDVRAIPLPARGHDLTICPVSKRCVVFARRPGDFATVFSADPDSAPFTFKTPPDRHFYGHGVFSRDGGLLYATENDFDGGRGVIGVYDAGNRFCRIGEFATHGVGPHDIALLRRAPILVVANGGMREHPDFGGGRRVLNPGALNASISYVDLRSGDLVERHDLASGSPISLRHLDVGVDDAVIIGAQLEKRAEAGTPVVFVHRRQMQLEPCDFSDSLKGRLKGYISSVAVNGHGTVAAVTSSRGGIAALVDMGSGCAVGTVELADVSGVATGMGTGRFLLTSGHGVVADAGVGDSVAKTTGQTAWQWDNHATMVGG